MLRYQPKDYANALIRTMKASPGKEEGLLKNFVRVLAAHNDFSKWRRTLELFEKLYIQEYEERHIEVHLARDDAAYRKKIMESVPSDTEVTFHIDPSIIGGMKIFINKETMIDGSVQKRIRKLFGS